MPSASPAPARTIPRQVSSWRARVRDGAIERRGGGQAQPSLGAGNVAELEQAQRHPAGGEELDAPLALELRGLVGVLAAGQGQVRHDLRTRVDVDPEQHLEVEPGPLALGDELGQPARHPADLLEVARRGREMHDRPVLGVGHGDDRRHDAGAVAEPLEDAEGSIEDLGRLDEERADRRRQDHLLDAGARRQHREQLVRPAGPNLAGEPPAPLREVDRPDLAQRGGQAVVVMELLREHDRPAIRLVGSVEVDLAGGAAERLAERAPQERLAELEGGPELHCGVAPLGRPGPDAARQLRGGVLVVAHPQRRGAPELDVELDGRIAHRLGERGKLGQAVEPLAGPAEGGVRVVAGREEDPPVGRRRDDRERLLDEPQRLLGGVGGEGRRRGVDREARGPGGVAGRERVLGEHRQAGGGRVATFGEQVDDRGVDLAPPGRRELVRGELADLLVGERVVGRLTLGLREQEAGPDGRREVVGERVGSVAGDRRPGIGRLACGAVAAGRDRRPRPSAPGSPGGRAG